MPDVVPYPRLKVLLPASWSAGGRFFTLVGILFLAALEAANCAADDRDAVNSTSKVPLEFTQAEENFALHVWPMIQSKCLPCHGKGKELAGGLDLRSLAGVKRGGDSERPAIIPGEKEKSPLYRAISRRDAEYSAMPPKENDRLSVEELAWFDRWLAAGAPWPDETRRQAIVAVRSAHAKTPGTVQVPTAGALSPEWAQRQYKEADLWAYRPLRRTNPRQLSSTGAIDSFLLQRLPQSSITVAPRADRRTLIRRATYDLIGMPPTPGEMESYLSDPADEKLAFAKVVDRLLASPHYGEHWGRHWLDIVRYADSSGFANDFDRGNAWRYRDYVVRAFNDDKPYDQFVREQIAGDELDEENPELLVAVGFLRMGPWELTGMEVAKIARQRFLDDVTDIIGQAFLAHPLQCARCHDHKFDPVPTSDYYRIQATLATTQLVERDAPFLPEENTGGFEEREYLLRRKQHFQSLLAELDKKEEAAARQWCADRKLNYVPRAQGLRKGVPEDQLPPKHVGFSVQDFGMERIARKGLERLRWELDRYEPVALSVYSGSTPTLKSVVVPLRMPANATSNGEVERTAILAGGDPFSATLPVQPGALSVIEQMYADSEPALAAPITENIVGRRKALAEWITHPSNPLTARVIANRVWQWHFGQAIAGNPNNFGTTGKKPTHPELLDWLATTLIESGWSLKTLHRLIMNSDAYQRSSEHPRPEELKQADPSGTNYAVFRPRRLTAEELRDSMLAITGELNDTIGGVPVRPEINPEVAMQPRQVMGTFAAAWQPSPLPKDRHRRTVYSLRLRGVRDPFSDVFNEPSSDLSCEERSVSTVTPQVFSLFNSKMTYDRAIAFALRLQRDVKTPAAIIDSAFQRIYGRAPNDKERQACLEHWSDMTARHRKLRFEPTLVPTQVVREAVEENTGENFRFIEQLESAADFEPDTSFADASPETRGLAEVCLVLINSNEFAYVY